MYMNRYIDLLSKTRLITSRAETLSEEKEKRGESFNIFGILKMSQYEAKSHTPFISELLNPKGAHGLKEAFLRAFIDCTQLEIELDCKTTTVTPEYNIGYKSDDCTTGGRIDIFITDKSNNAIILENKIYADDQKNQLLRYDNYGKANKLNYRLLYLTLEGTPASEKALGNRKIKYQCISYRETILKWLERCIELSACFPIVRETIRQYVTNIKELLNIMDTDNLNELIKTTTSPEFAESTLDIISNSEFIITQIRRNFINLLGVIAKRNNLQFSYDEEMCTLYGEGYIKFYNPKISEKWGIFIGAEKHDRHNGVFYGISQLEEEKPHVTKKQLSGISPFWEGVEQTSSWPYGWAYMYGENGQGNWWNWANIDTLKDMVNNKLLNYIENEIIKPILKNKLLQKIEQLTANTNHQHSTTTNLTN